MSAVIQRSHLDWLESEAIFILREVAAECERPVLLFSGGKDSVGCCAWPKRPFARRFSVSADAYRHRPQLRRGDRFP